MKDAVINFKTDAKLKRQAQKKAEELGISLSAILNTLLRKMVKTEDFIIEEKAEVLVPTKRLKQSIKEAREEMRKGDYLEFKNFEEEMAYLDSVIADAKRKENRR